MAAYQLIELRKSNIKVALEEYLAIIERDFRLQLANDTPLNQMYTRVDVNIEEAYYLTKTLEYQGYEIISSRSGNQVTLKIFVKLF